MGVLQGFCDNTLLNYQNTMIMEKFRELINGDTPVLVDFFATWCGPCKVMHPILEELKKSVGDKAVIIKVDIDKNRELASQYNVASVPTLIVFRKGEVSWRQSGVTPASDLEKVLL